MEHHIGIDEAGRGALAGPVVVAAVAIPRGFKSHISGLPRLKDSKKLSASQRELWYAYLRKAKGVYLHAARVYQKQIDKRNIARSANLAASRALEGVILDMGSTPKRHKILLDGGLYLGSPKHRALKTSTIIKGDEKIVAIKLASIVAKVTRDRYMLKLDQRYREYDFATHKGYGTSEHFRALKKHGISNVHRLTYLGGYPNLKRKRN